MVDGAVVDEILARTSSGGTTAWYLPDKLGSVRDIVSSSGSVLDHVVYDSFGNILTETNASNGDRFKFAGMEYDATTAQYYDHARYYTPASGRFSSLDPMKLEYGEADLYRYVGNDPVNGVDPTGELGTVILGGAACFIAASAWEVTMYLLYNDPIDLGGIAIATGTALLGGFAPNTIRVTGPLVLQTLGISVGTGTAGGLAYASVRA